MKHIQLYMLVTFVFCMQQISAGEQSQEAFETERQAIIDSNIIKYSYLSDAFNFLQSQDLIHESFHDFLDNRLLHDKDEELEIGVVIDQAEGVLTTNMRDIFIQTLENSIEEKKALDQFNSSIFLYAMQHKDDFMHGIVNLWLYEWSKTINDEGWSPLHRATEFNNQEITVMLINAGVDVNFISVFKTTPLYEAVYYTNAKIVRMLLDAGAKLNIEYRYAHTPLYRAVQNDDMQIVTMLMDAGADVNKDKNSLFCVAVWNNSMDMTRLLLNTHPDINYKYANWTPLYHATYHNKTDLIAMLIDAGADVNIQDDRGDTPLHRAVINNNVDAIRMLFDAGADLSIENNKGYTPSRYIRSLKVASIFLGIYFCSIS